jgi:polyisoprenoid-binding protein YceI
MKTIQSFLFVAGAALVLSSCGSSSEGPKPLTQFDACNCATVEDTNSPDYNKCKELRNDHVFEADYERCKVALKSGITDTSLITISSVENATNLSSATDGNYILDIATSSLKWRGENVVGKKHEGAILVKRGNITIAGGAITGGEIVIDMNTLNNTDLSGDEKAKIEGHLKSADFFNTAQFGEATYTIISGTRTNAINFDVKGKLTIKGITQDLDCKMVVAPSGGDITMGGGFVFDRSKFDVRYGSDKFFDNLGNDMIKNEVIMTVNLQGKKG